MENLKDYDNFILSKIKHAKSSGFEPKEISADLFDWQKHVVKWAIRTGKAALFEDCGLGKTLQQLEWANQVADYTNMPVIVLTLWSNPGELVYSPFAGIGSEGYQSLKLGRKFVGSELKTSYYNQACQNLKAVTDQFSLFD